MGQGTAVKLEFALLDDIKADIAQAKTLKDNLKSAKSKAVDGLIKYNQSLMGVGSVAGRAIQGIVELEKKSKDLGLDTNTVVTPYKKDLDAIRKEVIALSNKVESILSSL